jgi:protein-tyrosine phosphatase
MIDLHCHILPGLDDGPQTLEESVEMCRIAASDGIKTIVATPHFKPGTYEHPSQRVDQQLHALTAELTQQNIDLKILPGADVFVTPELSRHFDSYDYLTINRTGKYFLAEFHADFVPLQWDVFLLSFLKKGIVPIITHPERNRWFLGHRDALYAFVRSGGMVQITAMSLIGLYGDEERDLCMFLLQHDLVHIIATDAHAPAGRVPVLSHAVNAAANIVGREKAEALVTSIPEAVIAGNEIKLSPPLIHTEAPKQKTWLQRLANL